MEEWIDVTSSTYWTGSNAVWDGAKWTIQRPFSGSAAYLSPTAVLTSLSGYYAYYKFSKIRLTFTCGSGQTAAIITGQIRSSVHYYEIIVGGALSSGVAYNLSWPDLSIYSNARFLISQFVFNKIEFSNFLDNTPVYLTKIELLDAGNRHLLKTENSAPYVAPYYSGYYQAPDSLGYWMWYGMWGETPEEPFVVFNDLPIENASIPFVRTITKANFRLTVDSACGETLPFKAVGYKSAGDVSINAASDISAMHASLTTAEVLDSFESTLTNQDVKTIDVKDIIQEIIDLSGWQSLHDICLLIRGTPELPGEYLDMSFYTHEQTNFYLNPRIELEWTLSELPIPDIEDTVQFSITKNGENIDVSRFSLQSKQSDFVPYFNGYDYYAEKIRIVFDGEINLRATVAGSLEYVSGGYTFILPYLAFGSYDELGNIVKVGISSGLPVGCQNSDRPLATIGMDGTYTIERLDIASIAPDGLYYINDLILNFDVPGFDDSISEGDEIELVYTWRLIDGIPQTITIFSGKVESVNFAQTPNNIMQNITARQYQEGREPVTHELTPIAMRTNAASFSAEFPLIPVNFVCGDTVQTDLGNIITKQATLSFDSRRLLFSVSS